MKTKNIIAALMLLAVATLSSAQENKQEAPAPSPFSLEMITAMVNNITLKDFATQPYPWGFSFVSKDKAKLQKFVDALNEKEKRVISIRESASNGYICSLEDTKIFTAQSLYDRITYLNALAKDCGVPEVKSFGLMKD